MRFESLSEAIKYYSQTTSPLMNIPPYGQLAAQIHQVPLNTNYVTEPPINTIRYGMSIWGTGKIIDINRPTV